MELPCCADAARGLQEIEGDLGSHVMDVRDVEGETSLDLDCDFDQESYFV
jgi:hypothetical protein